MIKDKKSRLSLNSELNIFVSSLNAAVEGEIFSDSFTSLKVKPSFRKPKFAFTEAGLLSPGPIRLFGGPIRLWTDCQLTNQIACFYLAIQSNKNNWNITVTLVSFSWF